MATGTNGTVTQQFGMYPVSPLCLLPRCPLPPSLMRLDAWLPQHLLWVATGLIPPGFLPSLRLPPLPLGC